MNKEKLEILVENLTAIFVVSFFLLTLGMAGNSDIASITGDACANSVGMYLFDGALGAMSFVGIRLIDWLRR